MEHFINGKLDGQPIRRPVNAAIRHVNRFHSLRISKSNSNNKMEEMLPMKIDQFVTWNKILSRKQINEAFKEGKLHTTLADARLGDIVLDPSLFIRILLLYSIYFLFA